ncbi:probable GPI-anchored adhesin-like protein PGA55 [Colletes gigas]|uniref:probable GPI-anchored adhesin-like protein PGA55 n=1 Tax=Colletes gigas TaxID=935657 RepID=UPI001C9A5785|nr:probable GPI-anchored adhesin-like protein PGA55 [Colletes gigas]
MKNFVLLLLLYQIDLNVVSQPVQKLIDVDTGTNVPNERMLKPQTSACSANQYFEEKEGRCLGVTGGGKVIYSNNTVSCGTNVLKPYLTNPRYYYVCKRNKTILVQCAQGQHFENRLQKCILDDNSDLISTTEPSLAMFDSIQLPGCEKPGSFPVPGDCTLFYICETNGDRMSQNIFKCPRTMIYDPQTEMCILFSPKDEKEDIKKSTTEASCVDVSTTDSNSLLSESFTGDDKTSIYETTIATSDAEDSILTTDKYDSTTAAITHIEDKLLSKTVPYTQEIPPEFMEFGDNFGSTSSGVTYSTCADELITSEEVGSTESSLLSFISEGSSLNKQYSTVEESTMASTSTIDSASEVNASTEMGITEPALKISDLKTSVLNEEYNTSPSSDEFIDLEEMNTSPEVGSSESSLETSTLKELSSNEQYNTVEVSTTSPGSISHSTSAIEFTPLEEVSSSTEMGINEQYTTVEESTISPVSISFSTGASEITSSEEINTSVPMEISDTVSKSVTPDIFISHESTTEESVTEQSITETESIDFTSRTSSIDFWTPTFPKSSNKGTIMGSLSLLDDAFPILNEFPSSTEQSTLNDIIDTTVFNGINDELSKWSDTVSTENNIEDTRQMSTLQPYQPSIVESASSTSFTNFISTTESNYDFALSNSSDAANYFSTVAEENVTGIPNESDETSSEIVQIIKTLNKVSSLESTITEENKNNDTLHSLEPKSNSRHSDSETNLNTCLKMLQSPVTEKQRNVSSKQNKTVPGRQYVTIPQTSDSRKTISTHIALPLTSAVLNLTDKFERHVRDILCSIFKICA